jgi:ribonuclease-3
MDGSSTGSTDEARTASGGNMAALEARLGHRFSDSGLLREALTHASRTGGTRGRGGASKDETDNERLEFLGDRVLGLVIAETLLQRYPDAREGGLAPRLNALVRKETLAEIAEELGLSEALRLAKGDALSSARARMAILADACEAVIAAIYLDAGLGAARDFVLRSWSARLGDLEEVPRDAKTALQEWAQARGLPTPAYDVILREGPDHAPHFRVAVKVEGLFVEAGEGASKRAAEQAAAAALLARENLR